MSNFVSCRLIIIKVITFGVVGDGWVNNSGLVFLVQLRKPILLEGSPGVGKTSLIAAIARAAGRKFVRINLSEQTDMMDLLGADLPVEGGGAGEFAW